MKSATIAELKRELQTLDPAKLTELCIRLAKYKKDNKELLTYLLFEADDEEAYTRSIKTEMDEQFAEIDAERNVYFAKKSVRKILRMVNKFAKYSGAAQTQAELLIYFCDLLKRSGINITGSTALLNLYEAQLKKIDKAISSMHEDLQYDYRKELDKLPLKSNFIDKISRKLR